jgi:hypothetical protein
MKHEECSESLTAERYILGELSEVERDDFEEHCFSCPECADSVRCLSELKTGIRVAAASADPEYAREPERDRPWTSRLWDWWLRPQAALAGACAALAVAGVTGYQNLQMRALMQAQSVVSIALQPATRGDLPVVRSNSAGTFVLLEADVPGASGNLTWNLRPNGGDRVLDGTAPAPEPGLSFKLLLPSAALQAPDYTLSVRSGSGREWLFRFRTAAR